MSKLVRDETTRGLGEGLYVFWWGGGGNRTLFADSGEYF